MKYFLQRTSDLLLISKPCARSGRMAPFYFPVKNARNERPLSLVEKHEGEPGQETGYSLEVFSAIDDTIAVLVVEESKIDVIKKNEIFHVRRL